MTQQTKTQNIWDQVASEYEEYSYDEKDSNYPANKYRAKILLDFFKSQPKGRVLDAGCGTGFMTRQLLELGYEVVSVDSSKEMLAVSKKKTEEQGLKGEFHHGCVSKLEMLEDKSFDFVMFNGVLPYITKEDEKAVYGEAKRVLKDGGFVLASHYNLFFDFFRMDKYTIDSVLNGLYGNLDLNGQKEVMAERFASMLTEPNYPAGDVRTMKTENPLIFKAKLEKNGFHEISQAFYNFYSMPPRVRTQKDTPTRKWMEENYHNSWQGLFLAKTFVSIAEKIS